MGTSIQTHAVSPWKYSELTGPEQPDVVSILILLLLQAAICSRKVINLCETQGLKNRDHSAKFAGVPGVPPPPGVCILCLPLLSTGTCGVLQCAARNPGPLWSRRAPSRAAVSLQLWCCKAYTTKMFYYSSAGL